MKINTTILANNIDGNGSTRIPKRPGGLNPVRWGSELVPQQFICKL